MLEGASALEAYRRMVRIRRFEESAVALHGKGRIPGPLHTSIGQEAAIVGACAALRQDDYMTGTHRSHGHPIAKGVALAPLMAELMGKRTGVCKGKGGSMHLADFSSGSLGESAVVGSAIPVATGAGLSAQMRGSGQVALCFFGDGAVNIGAFHESLNLAALWRLPVVYVCENNGYAVSTPTREATSVRDVADRAAAYGIVGMVVDGQDVDAVWHEVSAAVARARSGEGPTLVEAKTYRYREHAEFGGLSLGAYRSAEEVAAWMARDPISLFRDRLVRDGEVTVVDLDAIDAQCVAEVAEAVQFAVDSPYPDPAEAFDDLYANPFPIRATVR